MRHLNLHSCRYSHAGMASNVTCLHMRRPVSTKGPSQPSDQEFYPSEVYWKLTCCGRIIMQTRVLVVGTSVMWIFFTSLLGVCTAQLTVQAENKVIVLPQEGLQPHNIAILTCFIQPQVSNARWITPDDTNVLSIQRDGQYFVSNGYIGMFSGESRYGSILIIQDVSYKNAGTYVCEAMDEDNCSDFPKFATVELVLKMTLEVLSTNITVTRNSESQIVDLQCEASGYIRPDSDIQWLKEDEPILEGVKYTISFKDGRPNATQTGHVNGTTPSRISVLTIYDVDESDVGTYICQSLDSGEMASLYLSVEIDPEESQSSTTPGPSTSPNSPGPSTSPSSPSTTMGSPGTPNCSISIATAVLCTFALTAILVIVITSSITYLWFKGKLSRRIKSGASSPDLGSKDPARGHTSVQEEVDMYQISTGDELEGSSGENSGKNMQ